MYNHHLFSLWGINTLPEIQLQAKLAKIGIPVDLESGHLPVFPSCNLSLDYELTFVRHGETWGNCGQSLSNGMKDWDAITKGIKDSNKRIFQGDVDSEINQLTEFGTQQAHDVAKRLTEDFLRKGWEPDIILVSPLTRARATAEPFINEHQFHERVIIEKRIKEISFGAWENKRICDLSLDNPCHRFYRDQHTLVKSATINSENFCELLLRAYEILTELNQHYAGKRILMFSHSMFGAACQFLFGLGQKVEDGEYLAFDGKRKDGSSYAIPHAVPIIFNRNAKRLIASL